MSSLFLVPKTDNSWRSVLNLKLLNDFLVATHFKLETTRSVKDHVQPGDWLARLDLKDAYLMVPIHQLHQIFLRFSWL